MAVTNAAFARFVEVEDSIHTLAVPNSTWIGKGTER